MTVQMRCYCRSHYVKEVKVIIKLIIYIVKQYSRSISKFDIQFLAGFLKNILLLIQLSCKFNSLTLNFESYILSHTFV